MFFPGFFLFFFITSSVFFNYHYFVKLLCPKSSLNLDAGKDKIDKVVVMMKGMKLKFTKFTDEQILFKSL